MPIRNGELWTLVGPLRARPPVLSRHGVFARPLRRRYPCTRSSATRRPCCARRTRPPELPAPRSPTAASTPPRPTWKWHSVFSSVRQRVCAVAVRDLLGRHAGTRAAAPSPSSYMYNWNQASALPGDWACSTRVAVKLIIRMCRWSVPDCVVLAEPHGQFLRLARLVGFPARPGCACLCVRLFECGIRVPADIVSGVRLAGQAFDALLSYSSTSDSPIIHALLKNNATWTTVAPGPPAVAAVWRGTALTVFVRATQTTRRSPRAARASRPRRAPTAHAALRACCAARRRGSAFCAAEPALPGDA
jgi:hypothetical protein